MSKRLLSSIALLAAVTAGCGRDPDIEGRATRTVEVEMKDIEFSPNVVRAKVGETVRFEFKNTGQLDHEAIIGNEQKQDAHEREMTSRPDGSTTRGRGGDQHQAEMGSDATTVEPGKTGKLTYTFRASEDNLLIGCHEPDHYEAGMRINVVIEA